MFMLFIFFYLYQFPTAKHARSPPSFSDVCPARFSIRGARAFIPSFSDVRLTQIIYQMSARVHPRVLVMSVLLLASVKCCVNQCQFGSFHITPLFRQCDQIADTVCPLSFFSLILSCLFFFDIRLPFTQLISSSLSSIVRSLQNLLQD